MTAAGPPPGAGRRAAAGGGGGPCGSGARGGAGWGGRPGGRGSGGEAGGAAAPPNGGRQEDKRLWGAFSPHGPSHRGGRRHGRDTQFSCRSAFPACAVLHRTEL